MSDILQGADSAWGVVEVPVFPGQSLSGTSQGFLFSSAGDGGASSNQPPAPPAASGEGSGRPQGVESLISYEFRRKALAAIATFFGMSLSLPIAGERLFARILAVAAAKRAVFSDYDETLGTNSLPLSQEVVGLILAVRRAGKLFFVVSDRPSFAPGPHDVSILDSLSTIPPGEMAGIVAASKKDGFIFRYDEKGEPRVLYPEPPYSEQEKEAILKAAEATVARLAELGTALEFQDMAPLSFGLILKVGTPASTVIAVAKILQKELARRGVRYQANPRLAKNPANPPYVTVDKIDKSWAVDRISKLFGVRAEEALILGDSMYAPGHKTYSGFAGDLTALLKRVGEWLSGRPAPLTGNATDRNMEKGRLKGALTLSVGGWADPLMRNAYVAPGPWREWIPRILQAVASGQDGVSF